MSAPAPLRVATRRSALATAQSRLVGEQLAALTGRPLELVEVATQGDLDLSPLSQIGGTGVFVVAVRQALVEGRADVAVHSLKDLPTSPDPRLRLASIPRREDPRDALVAGGGATLTTLPAGARVGTGSPRRRAQLAALRPDLDIVDIRGNVDTRISRVTGLAAPRPGDEPGQGDLHAVVLAVAGLVRLGRQEWITELIDPELVMPAAGQGALALEVRSEAPDVPAGRAEARDAEALDLALQTLDHPHTRAAVRAERALLAALEAGCSAPVGALAVVEQAGRESAVRLRAVLARSDGTLLRMSGAGPLEEAEIVGRRLAGELLARSGPDRGLARPNVPSSPAANHPEAILTTPIPATGPVRATGSTSTHRGSSA